MKTAVEYIELRLLGIASFDSEELRLRYKDIIKQAKEIEKEQMFEFANKYVDYVMGGTEYSAEEYYNDKYNQN